MPGESFQSRADALGQNEHALASVWQADFSRAEYSPRCAVTNSLQLSKDVEQYGCSGWIAPSVSSELGGDESLDVFDETQAGLHGDDPGEHEGEQVPRVFVCVSVSGGTERLARDAARDDVHASTKPGPLESFKIRPHRCRVQLSRFHFRNQVRDGEGFDLTSSDRAQTSDNSVKSEINASVSGTKADVINCLGSIHVMFQRSTLSQRRHGNLDDALLGVFETAESLPGEIEAMAGASSGTTIGHHAHH